MKMGVLKNWLVNYARIIQNMPFYRLAALSLFVSGCAIILTSNIPINVVCISLAKMPQPGCYQIYLSKDHLYKEQLSQKKCFSYYPRPVKLTFQFENNLNNVERLRFDLGDRPSHHVINQIAIKLQVYNRIIHLAHWPLKKFASQVHLLNGIAQVKYKAGQLHVIADGNDPHFDISFNANTILKTIPLMTVLGIKLPLFIILSSFALFLYYINVIRSMLVCCRRFFIRFVLKFSKRQDYPNYPSNFFQKNRYWLIAGLLLFLSLNFMRSWDNLTNAGLYMEDTAHYFNYYYGGDKPLSEVVRKPHGYINFMNNMFAWIVSKTDVRIQPTLYLILSLLLCSMAASSMVFSGLLTQRLTLLFAPTVLGLSGINVIAWYFILTYQMYTTVILLLCLLFFPAPQSVPKYIGMALIMNILIWSGPYSVLTIPIGLMLMFAFKNVRKNGLLFVMIISALIYYLNVSGGTTSLDNLLNPKTQAYMAKVLFEDIFFLGLLGSITGSKVILFLVFLSGVFYILRDDITYIKLALILLTLVIGALAPFFLSVKYLLYQNVRPCHILISIFFWLVFLLYSLDRLVPKIKTRLPIVISLYILLIGIVFIDNYQHPEKGSFPSMRHIPAYLDTIRYYEQLHIENDNRYVILTAKGNGIFIPRVHVGSKRGDAIQIGPDDQMAFYNNQFITEPEF